ncbi:MAG: adenylyltransferase/cytidyltransferase family protein [Ruminococcus flavefaciens]|nr:adenylyltransferase/cytidyltransferase family protein [Ruminococcus flavefaciens]
MSDNCSSLDVLLASREGDFKHISVFRLANIFVWLYKYRQITQRELTREVYIQKSINCIRECFNEGYSGWVRKKDNVFGNELISALGMSDDFKIIYDFNNLSANKKYLVDEEIDKEVDDTGIIIGSDIEMEYKKIKILGLEYFLGYICEDALFEIICQRCKNTWLHSYINLADANRPYMKNRTRQSYLKDKAMFPDEFIKDMFGDENYPLSDLLEDMSTGTQIVKINDGYQKFLSNYHSTYFNTDLFGHRVVVDAPKSSKHKIWLFGSCVFSGYVEEDAYTVASLLQKLVNKKEYGLYEVVDVSCDNTFCSNNYNQILEKKIEQDDIVVIHGIYFTGKNKKIIVDMEKIANSFGEKSYCWDLPEHSSRSVLKIITETIFSHIQEDMTITKLEYQFRVEQDLEIQINSFLNNIKAQISTNKKYQCFCKNKAEKGKIGAIVMNCNPFTYGHKYLIETAVRLVDFLFIFVVEEDKSIFSFDDRIQMVSEGTREFENVLVLPSGKFMISTVTFPGYFMKENPELECYDTFLDLKIFAHYIAPALKIQMRFVGEEPFDPVTEQYNRDMNILLAEKDILVLEIPRLKNGKDIISATKVRQLLKERNYKELEQYVPSSTLNIIKKETF